MTTSAIQYPAIFKQHPNNEIVVSFIDLPEALTGANNMEEAVFLAGDCLATAIGGRINDREDIPPPSPCPPGARLIPVPTDIALKSALYSAMRAQGVSKVELARRLGVTETAIRRLVSPAHASRLDRLMAGLQALGVTPVVSIRKVA